LLKTPSHERVLGRFSTAWMLMGVLVLTVFAGATRVLGQVPGTIAYEVDFEGALEKRDLADIRPLLGSVQLQPEGAVSQAQLRRRAEKDRRTIRSWLRSRGYYGGRVTFRLETTREPLRLVFQIEPGSPYLLDVPRLEAPQLEAVLTAKLLESLKAALPEGAPAASRAILDADKRLLTLLADNGYPLSRIRERKVVVDHDVRRVRVTYRVDPGPRALFGPLRIEGLESVDEEVVRARIPWREGQPFDRRLLNEARNRLVALDLFSIVRFSTAEKVDDQGRLPVVLTVVERRHRTFRGGLSYTTDTGPGAKVSWQHRNMRRRGERLDLGVTASPLSQSLSGAFLIRDYLRMNQSLQMEAEFSREDTDAYLSQAADALVTLQRNLGGGMRVGAGAGFRLSSVEEDGKEDSFGLLYAPVLFALDNTDDPLDPSKGLRLQLNFSPYWDMLDLSLAFSKLSASASAYREVLDDRRLVLAFKAAAGSILGAGRDAVPADIRFYVGGGGSVRGYEYQSVGPLEGTDPVGGRSFFLVNAEARWKITERYGMVLFVDGGSAYADALAGSGETPRWGAGLGLRYYSPLGPFRIDVAFPLNRREGIDDAFQFYVSLGQAF
jgi:translocation and assembly module TamA